MISASPVRACGHAVTMKTVNARFETAFCGRLGAVINQCLIAKLAAPSRLQAPPGRRPVWRSAGTVQKDPRHRVADQSNGTELRESTLCFRIIALRRHRKPAVHPGQC